MSDITLNGSPVIRGDIKLPYAGAWTAELELDADTAPSGSVSLNLMGRSFTGTVVSDPSDSTLILSGDSGGWLCCRIVGGAGGMQKPVEPQEWPQGVALQQLLEAILQPGGEQMAADVDPSLLAQVLPQWSIPETTAGAALSALTEYLSAGISGLVWRIRGDGKVWIGVPSPQRISPPDYVVADIWPESGQALWDLNDSSVDVDHIIDGLELCQVVYQFGPDSLRALVTFAPGPCNSLYTLFGMWMKRVSLDNFRVVPGRIASQNDGTSVQLQPDDSRFAPMRRVGIRLGLPDTTVTGVSGRANAAWEGALPTAPILQSFGDSRATKIKVGDSAPQGPKPLVNKSQRDAESSLNTDIITAYTSIGSQPPPMNLATALALLGVIQQALGGPMGLLKSYTAYEAKAADFLTTILEGG